MKNFIKFVLDGKCTEIDFSTSAYAPTTTVLEYLRSLPNHKGVKEGCAEGDCGACTVVIAGLDANRKLKYKAFDSCLIFLPMLHGKQLITVENLGTSDNLHPVQKALVDLDGSQCGFCTPGIVMSIFALYKNCQNPDRETVKDYLTGNLCRCTGYRPIIDAAISACSTNGEDHFTAKEPEIIKILNEINNDKDVIALTKKECKYFLPSGLRDAFDLRRDFPTALLVNGGTDIALRVTKKKELLPEIIDLSLVDELQHIKEEKDFLYLGAGVTLEEVRMVCKTNFPALYSILSVFGSRQIRNKATIGGNIGSASPIGDTLPVLMAYNATIILRNKDRERKVKLTQFIKGYRKTVLSPDELIYQVAIPIVEGNTIVKSYKASKRKDLDISTVSGGFRLRLNADGLVSDICLAYGGMAAYTKTAEKTEKFLLSKKWDRKTIEAAMELIDQDFKPISDARCSDEGRKILARNLLLKFWTETK